MQVQERTVARVSKNFLRAIVDPAEPNVDLVAVHGLNPTNAVFHAESTWTAGEKLWLRDFLPLRLPKARILLFGYNSNVAFETSVAGVREQAENLLSRLKAKRGGVHYRPLVFICHSLGGIIVKRALVQSKLDNNYEPIRAATYGIAFFGTPHRGGNFSALGDIASTIVRGVLRNPNNTFMEALKSDSLFAESIVEDFRHQLEDYYVLSFYETLPFKNLGLIVDRKSATLGLPGTRETQIAVDANHANVCKFERVDGDDYEQVADLLFAFVENAVRAAGEREQVSSTKSLSGSTEQRAQVGIPQRLHFHVPFDTNKRFIERSSLSNTMEDFFGFKGSRIPHKERIALTGMGGSGKTELAIRFAELHRHDFNAIFWLDGTSKSQMMLGLYAIANVLSYGQEADFNYALTLVQGWLTTHDGWLLIVDNLDDDAMITFFRTQILKAGMDGSVLVTSRNMSLDVFWDSIAVGDLTLDESRALIFGILGSPYESGVHGLDDASEIDSLLEDLGYLALAIDQAGTSIRQRHCMNVSEYRTMFRTEKARLLSQIPSRIYHGSDSCFERHGSESLWTTLELSFTSLSKTHPNAYCLMLLLALLCHEHISVEFLSAGCEGQRCWTLDGEFSIASEDQRWIPAKLALIFSSALALRETVSSLQRFSLIRWKSGDSAFSIHPLVHQWSLLKLSESADDLTVLKQCAIGLVTSNFAPQDLLPPLAPPSIKFSLGEERTLRFWPWREYLQLAAHAQRCLNYVGSLVDPPVSIMLRCLALLQTLDYISIETFERKRNLGLQVVETIRGLLSGTERFSSSALVEHPYFYLLSLTILIWDIVHTHLCACRKSQKWCTNCAAIYRSAWAVYQDLKSNLSLPPLIAAILVNLYYTIELNPPGQALIPQLKFSMHLNPQGSRAEIYNAALNKYYQMLICKMTSDSQSAAGTSTSLIHWARSLTDSDLNPKVLTFYDTLLPQVNPNDPNFIKCKEWALKACPETTSHKVFRKLCGTQSEEYRRSAWHLASACMDDQKWLWVESLLKPLVEQSIKRPNLSWSHERCIIMLLSCYVEMGNSKEARAILFSIRESYAKNGMTLRCIENSQLLDFHGEREEGRREVSSVESSEKTERPSNAYENAEPWQIFIKGFARTVTVTATPSDLVNRLYEEFRAKEGMHQSGIRFLYGAKQLEPYRMLSDYGIQNGSTLHMVLRLLGGLQHCS